MSENEDPEDFLDNELAKLRKMGEHARKASDLLQAICQCCAKEDDPEKALLNNIKVKVFWPELEKHIGEVVNKKD